jgi:glycosyltransferase involved in cell wall biosynthesis
MNADKKISICIPTWEQYGHGVKFLTHILNTIKNQTYKNFEVVISDHSIEEGIKSVVSEFERDFEITYVKNPNKRGNSPHNTNNALYNAKGEIIKIMFQDDFFYAEDALEKINHAFDKDQVSWVVNGSNHTDLENTFYSGFMTPYWNPLIYKGVNTISSPSALSFLKECDVYFDDDLEMLMDCEIYYNLYTKYGLPHVITDTLITNRSHPTQISRLYSSSMHKEIDHIRNKYKI